jgi:hypothetical protein
MRNEHLDGDDLAFQISFESPSLDELAPRLGASPAGAQSRHETARPGRETVNRVT